MTKELLYRVFYVNGGKFFISVVDGYSVREAITKDHENFKDKCLWFTFNKAQKIIKKNKTLHRTWGVVDENGKQKVAGMFDGILK